MREDSVAGYGFIDPDRPGAGLKGFRVEPPIIPAGAGDRDGLLAETADFGWLSISVPPGGR
jgi:hypothetical protein